MLASQIKTASDLKAFVEATGGNFFDRKTMKFFGDTMANYGVRKVEVLTCFDADGTFYAEGIMRSAFELYRRKPVKHNNQASAYFDVVTFKQLHSKA